MVGENRRDLEIASGLTREFVREANGGKMIGPNSAKVLVKQNCRVGIFLFFVSVLLFLPARAETDIGKTDSEDVKQLVKRADRHIRRGDYVEAERLLKRAIEIRPDVSAYKLKLAYLYVRNRRLGEAYDLAFPIARDEPKNARAFAVLGVTMLGAGRFPEARALLINSLKLNRAEALGWAGLGMVDFYENNIDQSLENLQEAVYYEPLEPDYIYALAQVSARAEKYSEAAIAYEDFLRISRNYTDERRERIKGLIKFLRYLGNKKSLYEAAGAAQTEIPFLLEGNRPIIEVRVDQQPQKLRFVLDTGSGISVISDETARLLKIKPITRGGFPKGIGGDGRFEIVYGFVREVAIGDVSVRNVPVYIRKFHSDGRIDGYIGLSLISKFLTTIDYGTQIFSLSRKESGSVAQSPQDGVSVQLRLTSSGFLSGEVKIEGFENPLNFIVDTGASISVISDAVAAHSALAPFVRDERMRVIGSAGIAEDVPSFLLPRVTIGSHSRRDVTAIALDLDLINEASGFEQSGILGGNFLRNYRMTFDFKNSRVTLFPIRPHQAK
ncbi:MAG: hypothetical protein C4324_04515 [Blastocatellia bacterium]